MNYRIGKADIRQLELRSNVSRGTTDIAGIMSKISFFEDIFSTYLTCNVDILDGVSLRNLLPISGGERVQLIAGERDSKRELESDMVVFKMSNKQRANADLEYYTLNLITPEHLRDSSIAVRNSYHKPISDIVNDVVNTYLSPINGKKLVEVEPTNGIHSLIATGINPAAFIRQCIREAESHDNPSSIYLFYETVEGYHFVTLDYLYNKPAKHKFVYDMVMHSEASPGASAHLQDVITNINFENNFDLLHGQMGGQFNSETYSFDPLSKTFRTSTYTYANNFTSSKYVNRTLNTDVEQSHFANPSATRFIITDSHRRDVSYVKSNDPQTDQTFRRRQNFMDRERAVMRQYSSIRLTISIPGNSNVCAGDTCQVILPAASDATEETQLNDRLLSGKYVVSAIAHNIATNGDYVTVMELIRPGYEERAV